MSLFYLKNLNYRLLVAIMFTLLAPTLYKTFRIYLISDIPDIWGFNIASQIAWLNIIYEILQETIILPLFFVLGPLVSQPRLFKKYIIYTIAIVFTLYSLIALLLWISTESLVNILRQSPDLIIDTIKYIRLESIAIPFRVTTDIVFIALISLSAKPGIYAFLFIQILANIIFDYVFISEHALGWRVIGVAYSTIVVNIITAAAGIFILFQYILFEEQPKSTTTKYIDWKKWLRVSLFSGIESGIRNVAFIIMILSLVNEIGEQGTLWITNGFIWGWLLLPILALGTLIKQDAANNGGTLGDRFRGYFLLSLIICLFWIVTIPAWGWFIDNVMGIDDYRSIVSLALVFLPFYIFFAINNVFDSYLYGVGRTDLMLYQSILINGGYYMITFILYELNFFQPTLHLIAMLFGFGIVLDMIATVVLFYLAGYSLNSNFKHTTD